jgi:flagellar basal body P-ring protein FlgI
MPVLLFRQRRWRAQGCDGVHGSMRRRYLLAWCGAVILGGCSSWDLHTVRSQTPDEPPAISEEEARLVSDVAVPFGLFPEKVEAVGLVTGLRGKGSDPEPSPQRSMLLEEMKRRGVKNPNQLLASRDVALVMVRGVLRPGIQQGDRFDVEVRIPSRSETASLRGGYLLETRLSDMAILNGALFDGKVRGYAKGPVLVDPSTDEKKDPLMAGRGRVLGGAIVRDSRSLGLLLKRGDENLKLSPDHLREAVVMSARVAAAINLRFHTFKKGIKVGVATAKTGKYVDLIIHPRYKDNVDRYMQVVRSVAIRESASEMNQRVVELEKRLLDPATSAQAAMQLEAIGTQGVEALLKGIRCKDREVQFYAAEALAYLDHREAAPPLVEAARREPAFRVFALTALASMNDPAAYNQLRELLEVPSAETRYGAFRALWTMNPSDALVKGEKLTEDFSYHVLDASGPPMIHVTRNRRAEVVLFGRNQRLIPPLAVNAGNQIMVTNAGPNEISVSKFSTNEPDQKRTVSTRLDDVIRAITELGGTYPDVVQALQEAKKAGALEGRFEVEALPQAGRTYERLAQGEEESGSATAGDSASSGTSTGAETDKKAASDDKAKPSDGKSAGASSDAAKKPQPAKGFFARMLGWNSGP